MLILFKKKLGNKLVSFFIILRLLDFWKTLHKLMKVLTFQNLLKTILIPRQKISRNWTQTIFFGLSLHTFNIQGFQ